MGLKERASSVKGKGLMTSFFVAEMLDTAMTKVSLSHFDGTEISPFGGAELINNLGADNSFILKTAIVAVLIGTYALSSIHQPKLKIKSTEIKSQYITEKALQGANVFAWGVVAWNSVQLTPDILVAIAN